MEKKALFIYNPKAGKGTLAAKLGEIMETLSYAGYRLEVFPTGKRGDATRRAAETEEDISLLVCAGGDGTLNEVIQGVKESNVTVPIGYIPVGSTNDFAASCGLPADPAQAAKVIVSGTLKEIDLGEFNGREFVYVAAFGAFTEVSYATDQKMKNLFGHAAYILNGISSIGEIKPYALTIQANGKTQRGNYIYGMITNSISVGGFRNITGKDISLSDGLFEVTLIHDPVDVINVQEIVTSLLTGEVTTPLIETYKASELVITSKEAIPWTLDGEFGGNHREVQIVNRPGTLRIMLNGDSKQGIPERTVGAQD